MPGKPPAPDRFARLESLLLRFRAERRWEKHHRPKDVALSLVLEAAELLEHFQWKTDAQSWAHVKKHKDAVAEELADVLNWTILLAHDLGVDLPKAAEKKIAKNARKYPVRTARNRF